MATKNKLISLKEASKISGYSSDYIGQLIRKGKLSGKQVFSNVAWMTTEEAIKEYVNNEKGKKNRSPFFRRLKRNVTSDSGLSKLYKTSLYVAFGVLFTFALFLFYILAVGIDKNIEQKSLEKIDTVRNFESEPTKQNVNQYF